MTIRLPLCLALGTAVACMACADQTVAVGENTAPEVVIASPATGSTFGGGDTLVVQGSATDAQSGSIAPARMEWWVELHHGDHVHPVLSPSSGAAGLVPIPRTGHTDADVFYRVYMRATDGGGLSDTAFVDVAPRLVELTLASEPPGMTLTLDHQPVVAPYSIQAIVGMERVIGAPLMEPLGSIEYEFVSWNEVEDSAQTITTPESDHTYTAVFREAGVANIPPSSSIATPVAGSVVTAGTAVSVEATAADEDGSITRVEFFEGTTRLGEDSAEPYALEWTPSGTGSRTLAARATDDDGATTMSSGITVTVQAAGTGDVLAPVATLTTPSNGTLDLTGAVAVSATATDNVGVTQVVFEVDGTQFAVDISAPYEGTLPSTAAFTSGVHVLRARAGDAAGNWSDWAASTVTFGGGVTLPDGFTLATYASGFTGMLTALAVAPDGRLFACEKSGALRVVKDGVLLSKPFVDLEVLDLGERGLLGIAFHPDFETNGYVYLYYTTPDGGAHNRISRFVANGDTAVTGSEKILADLPLLSEVPKHNGGAMHFGPDGKLYVSVGENGDGSNAPALTTVLGKILRFNADGSIPADNPFLSQTSGLNQAIWARGLRNPFTFAIEEGTGRMYINDVGESLWEEINRGRAGADYGWPFTEGPTDDPKYDAPILAYSHSEPSPTLFDGNAAVGAAFYHPPVNLFGEDYVGDYFFADYVEGWVYRLDVANGNAAYAFAQLSGFPTDLTIGLDGALYVAIDNRIDRIAR